MVLDGDLPLEPGKKLWERGPSLKKSIRDQDKNSRISQNDLCRGASGGKKEDAEKEKGKTLANLRKEKKKSEKSANYKRPPNGKKCKELNRGGGVYKIKDRGYTVRFFSTKEGKREGGAKTGAGEYKRPRRRAGARR